MISDDWRWFLSRRNVNDKIAVPRHQALLSPKALPIISELVRLQYLVHIDRARLPMNIVDDKTKKVLMRGIDCDIYKLTPTGAALCDAEGIRKR